MPAGKQAISIPKMSVFQFCLIHHLDEIEWKSGLFLDSIITIVGRLKRLFAHNLIGTIQQKQSEKVGIKHWII